MLMMMMQSFFKPQVINKTQLFNLYTTKNPVISKI